MTYIPVYRILEHIPNKFEAIKVAALECRRLNDKLQALEINEERKITTLAVERLIDGKISYYDARERREQERSEAMLAAAEEMLDMTAPSPETLAELEESGEVGEEAAAEAAEAVEAAATEASPAAEAEDQEAEEAQAATSEETKD
ncbi:MAG TPA: DNA-directed RNA polymerase subunit omega [Candidatus Krumholzibacteria bacterium]|nr:DNA-directed RNA polymerase subunit omega [Candidatus Krumholzibacteria bacterium]